MREKVWRGVGVLIEGEAQAGEDVAFFGGVEVSEAQARAVALAEGAGAARST